MKKGKIFAITGVVVLIAILIYLYAFNNKAASQKGVNSASAKVTRGNIEVSVSGSGTLLPIDTHEITSTATGTIKKVYVKNGATVEKGDKIAEFTNGSVVKAPAAGIVSGLHIKEDEEITGASQAPTQVSSAQKMLSAQNQLNTNSAVSTSNTFGKVINIEKMLVIFPVDEVDILKVKTGQQASVSVDALPEKVFTGEVTEVAEEGVVQNNVSTFDVTIKIVNTDNILKSGMTSNVNVVAQRKENVLLMPIEALQQSGEQKYVLLATEAGKSQKKTVEVGLTNESYAEILKGLNEGDKIFLPSIVEDTKQTVMGPFGGSSSNK